MAETFYSRHLFRSESRIAGIKYPHKLSTKNVENYVDNVDNLHSQKLFPYFYYVSGSHSYQHIPVHAIF